MKKSYLASTLVVAALVAFSAPARADLLNGSFESGTYTFGGDGAATIYTGSTAITGWTVFHSNVSPISNANTFPIIAQDGTVCLDLTGSTDSWPYGGVQQTITTIPSHAYDLTFWIGVDNSGSIANGPAAITASADSTSQDFTNTLTDLGNQWQQFTLPFTASSNSTLISLVGQSTAGGGYIGLDNVAVTDLTVPEPASLSLLVLGTAALLTRRRKA